jgi:hypothetical protein
MSKAGGWLVEMTTPALDPDGEPPYSRIVIPMRAIEQGVADDYVDALLWMHLKFLGFS